MLRYTTTQGFRKKYVCSRFSAVGGAVAFICCIWDIRFSLRLTLVQFDTITPHIILSLIFIFHCVCADCTLCHFPPVTTYRRFRICREMDNHAIIIEMQELWAQLTPIKLAPQTGRAARPNRASLKTGADVLWGQLTAERCRQPCAPEEGCRPIWILETIN